MVVLEQVLDKYGEKGEKTSWTFVKIDSSIAESLKPNTKKSFRVKGHIDDLELKQVALIPIGEGDFILPVNAIIRRKIRKDVGDKVLLKLTEDTSDFELSTDFLACLEDDPTANAFYKTLTPGHQRYFSKWIESAKTIETKTKRISRSLFGLSKQMDYGAMIRHFKGQK
ncbi:YdeI/OmpD-associated family protein [uncultured Arcticibacterium sp.]|mgnify:CR=1 FL=1|uniref:YdeI/OmpD-associated family protein n=1 Tax=uncultured Arcticibacterium sp. TaxID=2173042 RepID=UPI0030F95F20